MLQRGKNQDKGAVDKKRSIGAKSLDRLKANLAVMRPEPIRWVHLLATFFTLLLFSWLGIVLSRQSGGVATIWFTNGLLFAVVIKRPRNTWVHYFVAGFLADTLADVIYGDPLRLAMGVSVANSVE